MRTVVRFLTLVVALCIATFFSDALADFLASDACLDAGGRYEAATGGCAGTEGHGPPFGRPGNTAFWLLFLLPVFGVAAGAYALLWWPLRRDMQMGCTFIIRLAALAPSVLLGCSPDVGERGISATRDSAGVRMVESVPGEEVGRRVPGDGRIDIGGVSGEVDLHRVVDAVRLTDGRIVAGNAGTHELLLFDESGRLRDRFGREGEGPGEYRSLAWLAKIGGDSLVTYDDRLRRLDIVTTDGVHLSSSRLDPASDAFFPEFLGIFGDGSLAVFIGEPFPREPTATEVRYRDSLTVLRYDPSGNLLDTLGRFPNREAFYIRSETGDIAWSELPFGRSTSVAVSSDQFHVVTGDAYEVRSYDLAGDLRRIIRLDAERMEVAATERGGFLRSRRERISQIEDPARRRLQEELLERIPFPERHPGYRNIVVGEGGELWARRDDDSWDVFAADGRLAARARLPSRIDIHEIGDGYVLGGWRDELDIEHLVMIRIATDTSAEKRNDDS